MSSKAGIDGFASAITAGIFAVSATLTSQSVLAQAATDGGTTSIQQGAENARDMKEPSFQTREERLNAKPLDWNSTLGTPTPRTLTDKERAELQNAKRGSSAAGKPNPKADEEARKLHPDDWK